MHIFSQWLTVKRRVWHTILTKNILSGTWAGAHEVKKKKATGTLTPVLWICMRIRMFLGIPETEPDPEPSINNQKSKRNLDLYSTILWLIFNF